MSEVDKIVADVLGATWTEIMAYGNGELQDSDLRALVRATLERAAKVCEEQRDFYDGLADHEAKGTEDEEFYREKAAVCDGRAKAIRALKGGD
jgi:hypothetical protein